MSKSSGPFNKTLLVGRQTIKLEKWATEILKRANSHTEVKSRDFLEVAGTSGLYADDFFKIYLGSESVESIDCSGYEGASHILDLNYPLPESLHQKFDLVVDCGTLEHIFNLPQAMASLMNSVKERGKIFISIPCNNLPGHGFYQISPELIFRVFSEENGFKIDDVQLIVYQYPSVELSRSYSAYKVIDPREVGGRVMFQNSRPVMILAIATRIELLPIFNVFPLQSDYKVMGKVRSFRDKGSFPLRNLKKFILDNSFLYGLCKGNYERSIYRLRNTRFFKKVFSK